MKDYEKPELSVETLEVDEELASTVPTVTDEEYDEVSLPNDFGDDYWDLM